MIRTLRCNFFQGIMDFILFQMLSIQKCHRRSQIRRFGRSIFSYHHPRHSTGTSHEDSSFVECVAWKDLAELAERYVKRGDPLYIEGRLDQERWEKEGVKHSKHVVTLSRFVSLQPKEAEKAGDRPGYWH